MNDATEPTDNKITLVVDRMSIDLFKFWLQLDWAIITSGLRIAPASGRDASEQFFHNRLIYWSDDNSKKFDHVTRLAIVQDRIDSIILVTSDDGMLSSRIASWAERRFSAWRPGSGSTSNITLPSSPELTPTEGKVANWLAEGLSYPQIAKRLGGKTESAARKHALNLSKKWRVRQYVNILQDEAKRRGFGESRQ